MSDVLRTCRRTGCRWPADASLSFHYATREVWLETVPEEAHPAAYDLCHHHAAALTAPRGWRLADRRPGATPREPGRGPRHAAPSDEQVPARPRTGDGPAGEAVAAGGSRAAPNRYAVLSAALPRLAAEHAPGPAPPPVERTGGPAAAAAHSPQPVGPQPTRRRSTPQPGAPQAPPPALPEVEGQLAMPVPADPPDVPR